MSTTNRYLQWNYFALLRTATLLTTLWIAVASPPLFGAEKLLKAREAASWQREEPTELLTNVIHVSGAADCVCESLSAISICCPADAHR